jgi:thiol-disulfide isomerase/thioredoxin
MQVASAASHIDHGDAPGIDWFKGEVQAAFDAAASSHRPVFLYWGAKWCPPCQQLKSSVFARADFIQKSKQFVAVYLDGDEPRAQSWGQKLDVSGYPTVVILRPDQREITRISGGMDLSLYADLLDIALGDTRPMSEILAAMHNPSASLSKVDCQRLAYYGWELKDYTDAEKAAFAHDLDSAAKTCRDAKSEERARLIVAAAGLSPEPSAVDRVVDIVGDTAVAPKIVDALEGLGDKFFDQIRKLPSAKSARFQRNWSAAMQTAADNPALIDADRLAAIGAELAMVKAFSPDGKVPKPAADSARARADAALAKRVDPYVRAGIVNSVSNIYSQTGDIEAEYALLKGELATAKAPYYYMADLGEIEEERGDKGRALEWFERSYRESRGAATRFQWGSRYLSALLRMTPADTARIRAVAISVVKELDGPDRIQARTRFGLDRLEGRLRKWNDSREHAAVIQAIRTQMRGVCKKLPPSDGGVASCRKFLS